MTELSRRRKVLVLAICCMSLFMAGIDNTIVNVALPSIQHDLHASVSGLQWVLAAYTLVLASLLMLAGATGDRLGRRATFQTGLAIFTLGSLLCSLAPGLGWLVAFRMLQAVGGSMLNPVAMSIIANTFIDARDRARAVGIWSGVMGISMALGPVLGGALVTGANWRGIFWINIPVGLAAIVLTALYVPESRAARPRRPDPAGQVIVIVLLASLTYAIIEGPGSGWTSTPILGFFALAAAALAALVVYEPRRSEPLLDLRFFRSAPLTGATVLAVSAFAALSGFLLLITLYLQDARGMSAFRTGLFMLPLAAMTLVFPPLTGRVIGRWGPRQPLLVSGVMMTAGAFLLTGLSPHTPPARLIAAFIVFGIGFGTVNPPITNAAVSGMPRAQAGVAAAVTSTSRQVGQSLGVAVVGSALSSALDGPLATHLTTASHVCWWIITGCGAMVLLVGQATSGKWARRTAEVAATRLMSEEAGSPVTAGTG